MTEKIVRGSVEFQLGEMAHSLREAVKRAEVAEKQLEQFTRLYTEEGEKNRVLMAQNKELQSKLGEMEKRAVECERRLGEFGEIMQG